MPDGPVIEHRSPNMTTIEQTKKAELREISLEEMEQVSGGEFMNPDEWITACVISMEQYAKGLMKR
jgi:hypothetical protein